MSTCHKVKAYRYWRRGDYADEYIRWMTTSNGTRGYSRRPRGRPLRRRWYGRGLRAVAEYGRAGPPAIRAGWITATRPLQPRLRRGPRDFDRPTQRVVWCAVPPRLWKWTRAGWGLFEEGTARWQ